jgi:hypothetical protein
MGEEGREESLTLQEGNERNPLLSEGKREHTNTSPELNQDDWYDTSARSEGDSVPQRGKGGGRR